MMKFDDILEEIGEFGPYQRRIFLLTSLVGLAAGYDVLSVVFILNIPAHRCAIPDLEDDTFTPQSAHHEYLINLTIPLVENEQGDTTNSVCTLYNVTSQNSNVNFTQHECESWVYDKSVMESTVISEFNMVCKNKVFRSIVTMTSFCGSSVGSIVFGILGDVVGRKKTLIVAIILNVVTGVVNALSPNYVVYIVTTILSGFLGSGQFSMTISIVMEIVGPSKRSTTGISTAIFWATGMFLLTGVAYLIRQWRYLKLALALPKFLLVALWWLIPESPRWLLSKGKTEEAKQIIRRIAKSNKVAFDETTQLTADDKVENHFKFWHMFLNPRLILRFLIVYFSLFTVNLIYVALTLNVGNLSGNIYLNFFLSALTEMFGYAGAMLLLFRVGRRPLMVISTLVGGLACLAAIIPNMLGNESTSWIYMVISMVGKAMTSAAFSIIDIYAVELYPTVVRQSSMAVSSIFIGVGGMVAPYIADLGILFEGRFKDALPPIVFGSLSVAAGLLECLLPETRNRALPETIEDAINFGKCTKEQPANADVRKVENESHNESTAMKICC